MNVKEVVAGDRDTLKAMARAERDAKHRDRLRAVAMALDGEFTADIMKSLGRSKNFVQRWVYFYREGGIDAIKPGKSTGRTPLLTKSQIEELRQRIEAGPTDEDGVCTLRGTDIQRIIESKWNIAFSLNGVYQLLHREGYSCLKPRPRHEKNDPAAMKAWKESAPLFFRKSAKQTPARRSSSGSRTKPASASKAR